MIFHNIHFHMTLYILTVFFLLYQNSIITPNNINNISFVSTNTVVKFSSLFKMGVSVFLFKIRIQINPHTEFTCYVFQFSLNSESVFDTIDLKKSDQLPHRIPYDMDLFICLLMVLACFSKS